MHSTVYNLCDGNLSIVQCSKPGPELFSLLCPVECGLGLIQEGIVDIRGKAVSKYCGLSELPRNGIGYQKKVGAGDLTSTGIPQGGALLSPSTNLRLRTENFEGRGQSLPAASCLHWQDFEGVGFANPTGQSSVGWQCDQGRTLLRTHIWPPAGCDGRSRPRRGLA